MTRVAQQVQTWMKNFIKRCEYVGWRVELGNNSHYKVYDERNRLLFTFGSTPGDKRMMLNVLSQAKRAGLENLESLVKLREEQERLGRIDADRQANGYVEVAAPTFTAPVAVTHTPATSPPAVGATKPSVTNLGDVDGVAIMASAPANFKTPVMPRPAPLSDAEELLLADDSVVYRCLKPAATPQQPELTGLCHRTFTRVNGLQIHQTYHTRLNPPMTPNQRAKLEREREGTQPTIGSESVKSATTPTPPALKPQVITQPSSASVAESDAAGAIQGVRARVDGVSNAVDQLIRGLQNVVLELSTVKSELGVLPVADPDVIAKAEQFDQLQVILNGMTGKSGKSN